MHSKSVGEFHIHYNSDLSGDAVLCFPPRHAVKHNYDIGCIEIEIPAELLKLISDEQFEYAIEDVCEQVRGKKE